MNSTRPQASVKVLSLRTEGDPVLSVIAPLGLAAAAGRPCLMIDLDESGPPYPGHRSLADLVTEGPTRIELLPALDHRHSQGVALLRNGGVAWDAAAGLVEALVQHWPSTVLRLPADDPGFCAPGNVVPVVPLLPGVLAPKRARAAVWQSFSAGQSAPGPGPVLPPLSRSRLTDLLCMRFEPKGRWVKAWRTVWELPWA